MRTTASSTTRTAARSDFDPDGSGATGAIQFAKLDNAGLMHLSATCDDRDRRVDHTECRRRGLRSVRLSPYAGQRGVETRREPYRSYTVLPRSCTWQRLASPMARAAAGSTCRPHRRHQAGAAVPSGPLFFAPGAIQASWLDDCDRSRTGSGASNTTARFSPRSAGATTSTKPTSSSSEAAATVTTEARRGHVHTDAQHRADDGFVPAAGNDGALQDRRKMGRRLRDGRHAHL